MRKTALLLILWVAIAQTALPGSRRQFELDQVKRFAISAARPEYPYAARERRITGSGVYILHINANGLVSSVSIHQTSGNPMLDNAAVSAFKRWRFKPFGAADLRMPVTWTLP